MRRAVTIVPALLALVSLVACRPGTPDRYLQPGQMEDLLVDYHLARAMAQNSGLPPDSVAYRQNLYVKAALAKHGVTQEEFDSSMVYYYTRADRFEAVCKRVADRLEERALVLGASEGEIGKYAQLNATGDTANIWSDRSMGTLMPIPPYNRWDFELEVDSTYRRGDSFLLQFMSDYMFQDGSKSGLAYLAVSYDSDTTVTRNVHFSVSGLSQLNFPGRTDADITRVRGFFFLGDGADRSTTTRLLFLSNVQLIRFHKEKTDEEAKKDSIARAADARRHEPYTVGGRDTLGTGVGSLSVDSGAAPHRVARGKNLLKNRH